MFYKRISVCFTLLIFVYAFNSESISNTLEPPDEVSFIIVGFRHGYRNPAQFLKNDSSRNATGWGWEGTSQLTNIGKKQAYGLGQFIRSRYTNLLPVDFKPSEVKATSSSAERCQMTLLSVMAGVFPPSERARWNKDLAWEPVAFDINDPLLRMYNVKCPTYTKVYQPISDDNLEESKQWLSKESVLIKYIVSNTGVNGSLSDLADVADNVQSMIYNNASFPQWIEHPSLEGYNKQRLIQEILRFGEAHQIQCAFNNPCAQAMAGLWLNEILNLLQQKNEGKIPDRKAHFYAAHTETVLSLMRLMDMNVHETPTSAGMILEFKSSPASVRTIFHEPFPWNPSVRLAHMVPLPYCQTQDGWCPLQTFVESVKNETFSDWQEYCQIPKCPV